MQLSLDLLQHWLASHPEASMWHEDQPLAFKDVAPYQYSHGLPAAKSVSITLQVSMLVQLCLGEALLHGIMISGLGKIYFEE